MAPTPTAAQQAILDWLDEDEGRYIAFALPNPRHTFMPHGHAYPVEATGRPLHREVKRQVFRAIVSRGWLIGPKIEDDSWMLGPRVHYRLSLTGRSAMLQGRSSR